MNSSVTNAAVMVSELAALQPVVVGVADVGAADVAGAVGSSASPMEIW